nr:hypothetical protein [Tanacetum cinerariifolium]
MVAKFKAQELEINRLKAKIKLLEDKDRGVADQYGDNAPIKGKMLDEGEEATKRVSDDTKEMATVLTSMDAVSILTSGGVQVVPTTAEVATATVSIPTGSGVVSTASPTIPTSAQIFTTATKSSSYTRRKGKEKMVESDTPKKKKLQEQIDVQVMLIDGLDRNNETVAKYLQEYNQFATEFPFERRIELISDLVKYQDNYAKVFKYQTQQRKPLTRKQQREFYTLVLRNQARWKAKHFKGMTMEEIKEKFDPESAKKLKTSKEVPKEVKSSKEVPEEKVKEMMQLVLVEEIYVEALQVKHLIIGWKLWRLVKEFLSIRPTASDKEMKLWVELKRLYKPDDEDQLWTQTQNLMHAPVKWKLYDTCGVHHVTSKDKEIFMLMEKDYPLRKDLGRIVGNKMHKAFPLLVMEFPLPGEVPIASEESSHC